MQFIVIFIIAVAISMDSLAVALAVGSEQKSKYSAAYGRMVLLFGLFQGLLAALGWLIGQSVQYLFAGFDLWVAFFLIFASGIKMILASLKGGKAWQTFDISSTLVLIGLAVATGINAMIAGIAFGLHGAGVLKIAFTIGYTGIGITAAGIAFAHKYGYQTWYRYAELSGGIILISISIILFFNN